MDMEDDSEYYLIATQEFEAGKCDGAILAKAMAIESGDEKKSKYTYIRLRVEGLAAAAATDAKKPKISPAALANREAFDDDPDTGEEYSHSKHAESRTDFQKIDDFIARLFRGGDSGNDDARPRSSRASHGNNVTKTEDFFASLISGEKGLAKTFWLYAILPVWLSNSVVRVLGDSLNPTVFTNFLIFGLGYQVLMIVCVWNAAGKYEGNPVWARAARFVAVLWCFSAVILILIILGRLF